MAGTEDGEWVRVRYLEGEDDPLFAGTEDLVSGDEVEALLGVMEQKSWGHKVTVVLHHVPETEGFEGGYEAVTMVGVPRNVSVTGSDGDSAEGALNHLLSGLEAFGFAGRVVVEDATRTGGMERYELDMGRG